MGSGAFVLALREVNGNLLKPSPYRFDGTDAPTRQSRAIRAAARTLERDV